MFTSFNLLEPHSDQEKITVIGTPVRGAGWYGHTNGLHTVSVSGQNFTGRISIQATIATNPIETDWFSVLPSSVAYFQYPRAGYIITSPATGETSTFGFSFTANAVWVRATIDRAYFIHPLADLQYIGTMGLVEHILLKFGNNLGENNYQWPAIF